RDGDDYRPLTAYQLRCQRRQPVVFAFGKAVFDCNVAPLDETGVGQDLAQCRQRARSRRRRTCAEIADHRHRARLRPRREGPRRHPAEQHDELATFHSITSSAVASNDDGISMPSDLAVCKLMTNSNLVACNTGMSAGFSPLRTRPA